MRLIPRRGPTARELEVLVSRGEAACHTASSATREHPSDPRHKVWDQYWSAGRARLHVTFSDDTREAWGSVSNGGSAPLAFRYPTDRSLQAQLYESGEPLLALAGTMMSQGRRWVEASPGPRPGPGPARDRWADLLVPPLLAALAGVLGAGAALGPWPASVLCAAGALVAAQVALLYQGDATGFGG